MTMKDKLNLLREIEARNADRIKAHAEAVKAA